MDLSLVYFPSAILLGALHALEPGHAKTLTAAYLIGTKGTKRDATILGLSVATTHSIVVVALCVAAILLEREAFTGEASNYLASGSSVAVIVLGTWLLRKRILALKRARSIIEGHHLHSHPNNPVALKGSFHEGIIEIVDTAEGERFQLRLNESVDTKISVSIDRKDGIVEKHVLLQNPSDQSLYQSSLPPAEPHEFSATVQINSSRGTDVIPFEFHEPEHHHHEEHDHALLSDEEHARAHAAKLPDYVANGERPSYLQIMAFGAVGGLVPCPAAVSVMLLSLSLGQTGNGLILVLGFGLGLAVTLVGVGLLVVTGISKLASGGHFSKFSAYAPIIAACMVLCSGTLGLLVALLHHA